MTDKKLQSLKASQTATPKPPTSIATKPKPQPTENAGPSKHAGKQRRS